MTGFQGRAHIKIDPKGRIHLPSSFAGVLKKQNQIVVTNSVYGSEKFLDFYALSEWQKLEAKISRLPQLKSEVQAFRRFYLSSGEVIELDSQSRILVPQHLREYAQLEGDAVMVGMDSKIEIWNSKKWNKLFGEIANRFDQVLSVISDLDETSTNGSLNTPIKRNKK